MFEVLLQIPDRPGDPKIFKDLGNNLKFVFYIPS